MPPISWSPGEILAEEFLGPLGITQTALAKHIGVPVRRINEIVRGRRAVSPETAQLLAVASLDFSPMPGEEPRKHQTSSTKPQTSSKSQRPMLQTKSGAHVPGAGERGSRFGHCDLVLGHCL